MKRYETSARITLYATRAVAALLAALIFLLPAILEWYTGFRFLTAGEQLHITVSFYCCCVIIGWALWNMDVLLRSILAGTVFDRKNVRAIRQIQWCCGLVSLICAIACFSYLPLVFLAVIMAFLCLVVSVVASVMEAAAALREENDLTI